jgi:hypothetical protein
MAAALAALVKEREEMAARPQRAWILAAVAVAVAAVAVPALALDVLKGSLTSPVAISTMRFAHWFRSRGRLGVLVICQSAKGP